MDDNLPSSPRSRTVGRPGYSPPFSPNGRSNYNTSSTQPSSATPLAIRGATMEAVPPPLPPPTHPPVVNSIKQTWNPYGTTPPVSGSIRSGSSLMGSWTRAPSDRSAVPRKDSIQMPGDSLSENENRKVFKKEGEAESFPSLTAKFQEPRPLDTQNHRKATDAYDKHQLSKLGRPKTPTRSSTLGSMENSPIASSRLRLDTQTSLHRLTLTDRSIGSQSSDSPLKASSPYGRWGHLPHSGTMSPGMVSSASSHSLAMSELRSPTYEPSTAPSSLAAEHGVFSRVGSMDRGSNASLSLLSSAFDENERELKGRLNHVTRDRVETGRLSRASFDQGVFPGEAAADVDSDFTLQQTSIRSHHVDPREYAQHQQRHHSLDGSMTDAPGAAHQGIKRKASPSDASADEPAPQAARSRTPGRTVKRTSPAHQPNPSQASLSSLSTASLHNSPLPSINLSIPTGNVTSMGPQDHVATNGMPGNISESTETRQSHGPLSHPMQQLEAGMRGQQSHSMASPLSAQARTNAALQQEGASARASGDTGAAKPLLANIHMCDCCPKKPKKFQSLEALQAHQNEKQYYCSFCHNRFKNKNEAERHQNSLHLRKQSWSCAALENRFEKAFHSCNAVPSNTTSPSMSPGHGSGAEFDVCGYCGAQFSNLPAPDWVDRSKHLTEVHKFGECNQSKKFFRADHFRQHLKHSHGGQPGKWTNMLESACLRDEPPTPAGDQPGQEQMHHQHQHQHQHNQLQASQALQAVQQQATTSRPSITSTQADSFQSAGNPTSAANAISGAGQTGEGYPA